MPPLSLMSWLQADAHARCRLTNTQVHARSEQQRRWTAKVQARFNHAERVTHRQRCILYFYTITTRYACIYVPVLAQARTRFCFQGQRHDVTVLVWLKGAVEYWGIGVLGGDGSECTSDCMMGSDQNNKHRRSYSHRYIIGESPKEVPFGFVL